MLQRRRSKAGAGELSAFCWRYGLGHYGKGLFWHSSELLFAFFLTEQAGLPPVWMGTVLIAGILSSAGIDLLVGRALRRRAFTVERALIIGVETDLLFPIDQQQELADGLDNGTRTVQFARLPSLQGHDSFLVDMDRFRPVVSDFLATLKLASS